MDIGKIKTIIADPEDPALRRVLLRVAKEEDLPEETRAFAAEVGSLVNEEIVLGYDHWNASESRKKWIWSRRLTFATADILQSISPLADDEDPPSSFTQTGHIAHLNLRDEWLPFKHIIGQVIIDVSGLGCGSGTVSVAVEHELTCL